MISILMVDEKYHTTDPDGEPVTYYMLDAKGTNHQ